MCTVRLSHSKRDRKFEIYQRISEFQIVTGLKDDTYRRNYDFQILTPQSRKDSFKMCRGTELVSTDVESISKADKTCDKIDSNQSIPCACLHTPESGE